MKNPIFIRNESFGQIQISEDKILTLVEDAYYSNHPDDFSTPIYKATALDEDENEYFIFWDIIDHECEDQSSACDWNIFWIQEQ